jgi:omega-amidase
MSRSPVMRISLLQMDISFGNTEDNYLHAEEMVRQAAQAEAKPDLVVLPEMWNTGYAMDRIKALADPEGERTKLLFSSLCREHDIMAVTGSIAEGTAQGVRNTSYVVDREGHLRSQYSKLHLFGLMDEDKELIGGDSPGKAELEDIAAGVMICYDLRFPELARTLVLGGAKLLIVPAQWPKPRLHHWRTLLMARAIENQVYIAACNRVGEGGGSEFFGHSMIIDPWGRIIAEAGEEETVLTADISLELVDEVRRTIPVFRDRRPGLYNLEGSL